MRWYASIYVRLWRKPGGWWRLPLSCLGAIGVGLLGGTLAVWLTVHLVGRNVFGYVALVFVALLLLHPMMWAVDRLVRCVWRGVDG